jgi:Kef-type K+ transport system membrane component KefB
LLLSLIPAVALADGSEELSHTDPVSPVLLALTIMLISAKLGGALLEKFRLPAVLGELVAGVVIGNIVLINPAWTFFEPLRVAVITAPWATVIDSFARIGVVLLLFSVGLESTVAEMRKVGVSSFFVAVAGVVAPFILGYFASSWFIKEVPPTILAMNPNFDVVYIHLFIGATLTATSVGITARVFQDLGKMHLREAKIILGAAVIDDVLGLIILAVVGGIVVAAETGTALSITSVAWIITAAVGFLVGAILLGQLLVPRLMGFASRIQSKGMMIIAAVGFCFMLAYSANLAGLAPIVGAYAAGLILEEIHFSRFNEKRTLHELLEPVTSLLVPIFFVLMGIQVRLETFADPNVIGIALGITVAAFIGKQVCGLAVAERGLDRLTVGLGMIPRGEVGLIFASIGKSLNVVDDATFSAVVIMVILSTFVTPGLLKWSIDKRERSQLAANASRK